MKRVSTRVNLFGMTMMSGRRLRKSMVKMEGVRTVSG